jgi:hypothetical protein
MQKLTGISSGQNNKSCRIIHNGSNKIGFTFFCDFLRNLQESANSLLLFQLFFCSRDPRKIFVFAMWSLGAVAGAGWANSGDVPPDSDRGG